MLVIEFICLIVFQRALQFTSSLSNCVFPLTRKNPAHFQECSHPGDSDYEEEEAEDADDDRPECPYGTHCYRWPQTSLTTPQYFI